MSTRTRKGPGVRRDRLIHEHEHDPYKEREHVHDPTVCPECDAVFRDGRWRWAQGPADAPRALCPACRRTRDRYPAGLVTLSGDHLRAHRDEILRLVRHVEEREKREHPMERIMAIEDRDDGVVVSTTEMHLARAIGEAVHDAHHGTLDYRYVEEDSRLRVTWSR
jgi:NMD protein affecting ribosome stability and mRNA decay